MKPFTKRLALVMGLLFTALICMGIVFIDNVKHYWITESPYVRLYAGTNFVMGIHTNNGAIGVGTTNDGSGANGLLRMTIKKRDTVASGNGTSAAAPGRVSIIGGFGGDTTDPTTATGGAGGGIFITGGNGGTAAGTTNSTGGGGAPSTFTGGLGGSPGTVATNAATGGNGGGFTIVGGAPNGPTAAATNTVGGNGAGVALQATDGAVPSAGWARKGGNGGGFTITAGNGGNSTRTNGGDGGSKTFVAGNAGANLTAPGDAGAAGMVGFTAGNGANAIGPGTNSNGGKVYLTGGTPGTGATPGNIYLGRTSAGAARGGVVIGLGEFTITNMLGGSASLDFPSTAAGTFSDLPITVTGTTSNGCSVVMGIPWEMAQSGGAFTHYESNDTVFIRFINNFLVSAIDPSPATVTVVVLKNQ